MIWCDVECYGTGKYDTQHGTMRCSSPAQTLTVFPYCIYCTSEHPQHLQGKIQNKSVLDEQMLSTERE